MSLLLLDPFKFFENGDSFELDFNVRGFKPEELSVKVTEDRFLVVEGKHGEKKDQDGSISRHFIKKCVIPSGFDLGKIQSKLYPDGVLVVSVPRIEVKSRKIPVVRVKNEAPVVKAKL
ncbi:Heat shock protein 67B1-like Protein [Tribolium castaneum]|uniref:Heat shock protein 67B1-like Protein n=1 Tax=Tribolium castaneum TaxID=7070 RepID=D6WXQ9_TRICA|nr:PREDICTED: heat shock protein 26 [Tribolium castaneum]EFA08891.1 Heat shock protein 67B1-like Protein [Tribolium castaneum]|eukprot:XP_973410.1 PREDICTED: heat shock protein 26 [Tribolium castaneum]